MVTILGRQLSFHPSPGCSAPRAYTLAALQRAAAFTSLSDRYVIPTDKISSAAAIVCEERERERERVGCLRVRIQPEGVSIL